LNPSANPRDQRYVHFLDEKDAYYLQNMSETRSLLM